MPKITIIVPMYNVENYIEKCIESCINQTLKDIEILIIDDESKDKSLEKAQMIANSDERIHIYTQKNSGVSVARNKGIEESKSDWIMFLDGDDWLEDEACEKMYNIVIENKCDVLITGFYEEGNNYTKKDRFLNLDDAVFEENNIELVKNCIFKTNLYQPNSVTNIGVPWAKLYSKEYITKNNLSFRVGLKRMQDMVFNIEALYLSKKIIYKDFPTYHYRCQNNSVTNKYSKDFDMTCEMILNSISDFINKYNLQNELEDFYKIKSFLLFDEIIKLKYVPKANKKIIFKKLKSLHVLKRNEIYRKNCSLKLNKYFNYKLKLKNIFYCLNLFLPLYFINFYKLNKKTKKNY